MTFTGQADDRRINAGNELKNLEIKFSDSGNYYIARARAISTKCQEIRLNGNEHELMLYTVRGLGEKSTKVYDILKTQRDKSFDEVMEICSERNNQRTPHVLKGSPR